MKTINHQPSPAATHTPGPWFATDTIVAESNRTGSNAICDTAHSRYDMSHDEAKANARLIAAAPDLLAALEMVLNSTTHPGPLWTVSNESIAAAHAAIARAKGES
jgi:hypothetical protein